MFRDLKTYSKQENIDGAPSVIHTTFEPTHDDLDRVEFDIKSIGHTAHMSSTIYLERVFRLQTQRVMIPESAVLATNRVNEPHLRQFGDGNYTIYSVLPGFTLQQNASDVYYNFNGGSVRLDANWIAPYAKLYAKDLEQFIRNSGRRFSNHKDSQLRSIGKTTILMNSERIERRFTLHEDMGYVHYYWREEPLENGLPFEMHRERPVYYFGWRSDIRLGIVVDPNDDSKVNVTDTYNRTLTFAIEDGDRWKINDTHKTLYEKYWKKDDDKNYDKLKAAVVALFDRTGEVLYHERNADNDPHWNTIRQLIPKYFKPYDPDDDDSMNHFGWGYDLRYVFDTEQRSIYHKRTVALLLRFVKMIYAYFEQNLKSMPLYKTIQVFVSFREVLDAALPKAEEYDEKAEEIEAEEEESEPDEDRIRLLQDQMYVIAEEVYTATGKSVNFMALPMGAIKTAVQLVNHYMVYNNARERNAFAAWRTHSNIYSYPETDAPSQRFLMNMQVINRWYDLYSNSVTTGYEADFRVCEPILLGPTRPNEYKNIGCWGKNSSVFPYVERFQFCMRFKDKLYFETEDIHSADIGQTLYNTVYPQAVPISVKSKLHVTFVEDPVTLPISIPYIDTYTQKLAEKTTAQNTRFVISFQDISLRRKPSLIMFYCRSEYTTLEKMTKNVLLTDKSCSIVSCTLRTDNSNRSLKLDSKMLVDIVSTRRFPQYTPPIGLTGNVLALAWADLPIRKNVSAGHNRLHGEVEIEQDWYNAGLKTDVYVTLIYNDSYFAIDREYQTCRVELDEVV